MRRASSFEFLSCDPAVFVSRKYEQALEYHRQALVLIPQHASTYSAIGYVHSLMGDFESAIDYFHTVFSPRLFSFILWAKDRIHVEIESVQAYNVFSFVQALGLKRDDTFSVTMLGHCIEMYIGDTDAYIGRKQLTYAGVKQGCWFDRIARLWSRLYYLFTLFIRQTHLDDCVSLLSSSSCLLFL